MQTLNIQNVAKLKNDLLNEKNTTEKSENGQNITAEIWKKALNDILDPTSKMSEEDEKEYHSRCSFLCGHWDYCLCHVWVFGRKLPQGPVNLRGEKHL